MNNSLYSYNRYSNTSSQTQFSPNSKNWLISAQNRSNGNNYYFQNLSSYNNWANTCCGASYEAITSGNFNNYNISFNKL